MMVIHVVSNYLQADGSRSLLGESVYRFLYRFQWYLVDALARCVVDYVKSVLSKESFDLVMLIPRQARGSDYNDPPSLLEDWISSLMDVPRVQYALQAHGAIAEISEKGGNGGYALKDPAVVKGKHVLLVDGVYRYGHSFSRAVEALEAADARVTCVAITQVGSGVPSELEVDR